MDRLRQAAMLAVTAVVSILAVPDVAQPIRPPYFYDGDKFRSEPEAVQVGYVVGSLDAVLWAEPDSPLGQCFAGGGKFSNGFTVGQAHAIVVKYLDENPGHWNLSMPLLVPIAIYEACRH